MGCILLRPTAIGPRPVLRIYDSPPTDAFNPLRVTLQNSATRQRNPSPGIKQHRTLVVNRYLPLGRGTRSVVGLPTEEKARARLACLPQNCPVRHTRYAACTPYSWHHESPAYGWTDSRVHASLERYLPTFLMIEACVCSTSTISHVVACICAVAASSGHKGGTSRMPRYHRYVAMRSCSSPIGR